MKPKRGDRQGYSLLDLVVAGLLGAIISYILFLFMTGIGRHYFNISEKMTQFERASVFERRMSLELARTSPAGVTPIDHPPGGQSLAIQSYEAAVPPGRLRWSERVCVFRFDVGSRLLTAWPTSLSQIGVSTDYGHPEILTTERIAGLPIPGDDGRVLKWERVTEFQVEKPQGPPAVRVAATFEEVGVRRNRHHYRTERVYPIWNDFEP